MIKKNSFIVFTALFLCFSLSAQVIDQVVAVIGDKIVLQSDVEQQIIQLKAQGIVKPYDEAKCLLMEELLMQKLLVNQAELDSVTISPSQVEMQLDQRIDYFIERIGSKEKLEEYFKKTVNEIKKDFRIVIYEQLLTQKMQSQITGNVNVTPSDIASYYKSLPKDSIPYIESKMQIAQIVRYLPSNEEAELHVKQKMLDLRKRILDGESFSSLAVLYSEDGSSMKGGEIGYMSRGELDSKYAEAAFKLKVGGVSNVIESSFGYHIIQLIDKKDNKINTRHILMIVKHPIEDVIKVKNDLDSIVNGIKGSDSLSFAMAAKIFSDDKETRHNGGLLINFSTRGSWFEMSELDAKDLYVVKRLNVGDISEPYESSDQFGKRLYKVIQIKEIKQPHVANLTDDYDLIKNMATNYKRQQVLNQWIIEKKKSTYIKINELYKDCSFYNNWLLTE